MGFETTILPLTTPQVAVYLQPQLASLASPVFGEQPRNLSLDALLKEPQWHSGYREGWLVYDEEHLFQPHLDRSLYIGDQQEDIFPHLKGKKYGERFPSRLLPSLLATRSHPRLEKRGSHVLQHEGVSFILEAISPRQELLFRRVGKPNWSGLGEDHLIVSKKDGKWMAERQSMPTQPAFVDNIGDGMEDSLFEHRVLPEIPFHWVSHKISIPVQTTNPQSSQLPSVAETMATLSLIPPLLLAGLQGVSLVDETRGDCFGQIFENGVICLYQGSHEHHLHATLFHELAHWFAMRILGSLFLAEQANWIRAMMQDARNPSGYAITNIGEDFAEAVALYFLTGGGRYGNAPVHFRHRFELLDALFYDCFTPKYHTRDRAPVQINPPHTTSLISI